MLRGLRDVVLSDESLRAALVEFLVAEFKGELLPTRADAYALEVRIDGRVVHIGYSSDDHHVGVFMDRGGDSQHVATIAGKFDGALATGAYDRHFMQ